MAEWKLDHFAKCVDRPAHSAQVVISDVGAPVAGLAAEEFGKQLDVRLGIDVDNALGRGRDDDEPHFLQSERGRIEHLSDFVGDVRFNALVADGGDGVAFTQGPSGKGALQGSRRSLEPDIVLRRGKDDLGRRLGLCLADFDEVAGPGAGIGAGKAVQPDDLQPLVAGQSRPRARAEGARRTPGWRELQSPFSP